MASGEEPRDSNGQALIAEIRGITRLRQLIAECPEDRATPEWAAEALDAVNRAGAVQAEIAAILAAVTDALRGRPVSDFMLSFAPVLEAQDLVAALNRANAATTRAEAGSRDQL